MRLLICLFFSIITKGFLYAQLYIPLGNEANHISERAEIKSGNLFNSNYHSSTKPFTYESVLSLLDSTTNNSYTDSLNIVNFKHQAFFYIQTGKREHPILKYFYVQNAALYNVSSENFSLSINPIIHFAGAYETGFHGVKFNNYLYINSRGVEMQGIIDHKISFYVFATDNQMRIPLQTKLYGARTYALPGESYYKNFKGNAVDFFHAEGYVSAPITNHINFQFGSSKQFIGDGIRSLILSDFSKPHLFLKLNTRIWKINYQNLFYELTDSAYTTGSGIYKKKFGATHHLSIDIGRKFNLGFFETVIFKRDNNAYELNYLNPVIFYRAAEHSLGSPDNVLLGMDYKWNFSRHYQVYGQIVFDEFLLTNMRNQFIKSKNDPSWGWYGNKFAVQAGFKAVDLFKIKNLDIQLEYNLIRPYTYAYTNSALTYTDFNQSMAHPLGANLKEITGIIYYQPSSRLLIQFKTFTIHTGIDSSEDLSYGADLLKSTHKRLGEFGNATGQGIKTILTYYELSASYRLFPQCYIDAGFTYRRREAAVVSYNNQNQYWTLGLRLNCAPRNLMY